MNSDWDVVGSQIDKRINHSNVEQEAKGSMFVKLLKAFCILGVVFIQYGIVILNLNQYWKSFQKFIELEFHEKHSERESMEALHNKSFIGGKWPSHSK